MNWKHFNIDKKINIESLVTAFEQEFEPGFVFQGESHNFWELFYVEEGTVCVSADERVLNLSKNEIIFHKPMELHKFYVEETTHAKAFIMSFSLSGEQADFFEKCALTLSSTQRELLYSIVRLVRQYQSKDADFKQSVLVSLCHKSSALQQLCCMTELFLLSLLENSHHVEATSDTLDTKVFKKCVTLMEQNVCEWISVPELAAMCNVSVSYLKKIFSKYAGFGVHKYFLKIKIIYASELLKQGKTVSEVARLLSFSSQNYFSIVFKRETGLSPLNFKNKK